LPSPAPVVTTSICHTFHRGGDLSCRELRGSAAAPTGGTIMTVRTTPPFRADHVGSLLRPERLLRARADHAAGLIGADQLRAVEDDAIRDVIKMQRDVGLKSATDGEFRRTSWHMDFIYRLGGIGQADGSIQVKFHNADGDIEFTSAALHVDAPVTLPETIFGD